MLEFLSRLTDTSDFPARWHCGRWSDTHGWIHIISDLATFSAYMTIPVLLAVVVYRRRADVPFPRVLALFSAFIFVCGLTHLMEAIIFWEPMYRLAGTLKLTTAVVSWFTVAALIPVVPRMMAMRFPEELESEVLLRTRELDDERVELESARAQLASVNEALRARNQEMETFVHTVSHDLKAPLVTTGSYLDIIEEAADEGETGEVMEAVVRARAAGARMNMILGDLLTLSREGARDLNVEMFEVRDAVALAAPVVDGTIDVQGVLGTLFADRSQVVQVLENLFTNAAKYGRGRIELGMSQGGGVTTLWVDDDGDGVPIKWREQVFRLFERLHSTESGTGVGLAIVKRIMERHAGRAWIETSPLGGARVLVEFPNG